ncbi:MAG: hypothetical protein QE271_05360 [Bacteriovoracaceae bacterium]|nr:hypothetical protein [Bacteriovoracaceae bacterium]
MFSSEISKFVLMYFSLILSNSFAQTNPIDECHVVAKYIFGNESNNLAYHYLRKTKQIGSLDCLMVQGDKITNWQFDLKLKLDVITAENDSLVPEKDKFSLIGNSKINDKSGEVTFFKNKKLSTISNDLISRIKIVHAQSNIFSENLSSFLIKRFLNFPDSCDDYRQTKISFFEYLEVSIKNEYINDPAIVEKIDKGIDSLRGSCSRISRL